LSRTRDGHALRADDVTDAIVDRRRRVHVALSRGVSPLNARRISFVRRSSAVASS
jgi:hypothetical protein